MGHLPAPVMDFTNTATLPDSFEEYAIQRPSRENTAPSSSDLVCNSGSDFPGLGFSRFVQSIGISQTSLPVSGFVSVNAIHWPSRENEVGCCAFLLFVSCSGSPLLSARTHQIPCLPWASDANAMRLPSGVQTGK